MENNDIPPTPPPSTDKPEFPGWLCQRVMQKLKAARLAQKAAAMAVSKRPGVHVSDQTILDNDGGEKKNPGLGTLVRHAHALGIDFFDLMQEIRQELPPAAVKNCPPAKPEIFG